MLTDKQERFCREYLIDENAGAAYIRAGYCPKGADKLALRLMERESIRARMEELSHERESELIATPDEVLQALTRVLRREEPEQVVIKTGQHVPIVGEDGRMHYAKNETTEVVNVRPKLSDVNRAAELLGKRHGLWAEKVELGVRMPVIIDDVPRAPVMAELPEGVSKNG